MHLTGDNSDHSAGLDTIPAHYAQAVAMLHEHVLSCQEHLPALPDV